MAITNHEIDVYRIYHYSNDNSNGQTAIINCFQANTLRAALYFYKTGTTIPPSAILSSGTIYLRFNEARFSEIVSTLRLEEPIHVHYNDGTGLGWLSTSVEPIGEEESV